MDQWYKDDTKRPNWKENQLGILKIYAFCRKIEQRVSSSGESAAWVTYLFTRTHPKSAHPCKL